MNRVVTNCIYLIIGILLGSFATRVFMKDGAAQDVTIVTDTGVNIDSLRMVVNRSSAAVLVARNNTAAAVAQANGILQRYYVLRDQKKVSDTVFIKGVAAVKIDTQYIEKIVYVDRKDTAAAYALKLPTQLTMYDDWLSVSVSLTRDSARIDSMRLNGTISKEIKETRLNKYMVQRSVMFVRDNPYVSNWNDAYIEEPRYTKKGVFLKQLRVAVYAVPITFLGTYFAVKTGVLK